MDHSGGIKLDNPYEPQGNHQPQLPQTQPQQLASPLTNSQYALSMSIPTNYFQPPNYPPVGGPSYQSPRTPPPPSPPSNVGYIRTFLTRTNNLLPSYVHMPSSTRPPGTERGGPGFTMGVGAGALAAGAMIFSDDFMSRFDFPGGLQDASLTISANPPF